MRFNEQGKGFLTGEGVDPMPVSSVLSRHLVEEEGRLSWVNANEDREPWSPPAPGPEYGPLPFLPSAPRAAYKNYSLAWQTRGIRQWWVLGIWVECIYGIAGKSEAVNHMASQWGRWSRWVAPLLPLSCALRRSNDKRGRDKSWTRMLLETCASTAGLLSWLVATYTQCEGCSP